jgi:hypothetical protein
VPSSPKVWVLHSAAPFAVVRWTNIYDPARLVFSGDIIGGPLARTFGPAIIDSCAAKHRFTHTRYWELDSEPKHIEALRSAVNLLEGYTY